MAVPTTPPVHQKKAENLRPAAQNVDLRAAVTQTQTPKESTARKQAPTGRAIVMVVVLIAAKPFTTGWIHALDRVQAFKLYKWCYFFRFLISVYVESSCWYVSAFGSSFSFSVFYLLKYQWRKRDSTSTVKKMELVVL